MEAKQNIDELVFNAEVEYLFREAGILSPDYVSRTESLSKPSLNELSMMQVAETVKDLSRVEREDIQEHYPQVFSDSVVDPINPDFKR